MGFGLTGKVEQKVKKEMSYQAGTKAVKKACLERSRKVRFIISFKTTNGSFLKLTAKTTEKVKKGAREEAVGGTGRRFLLNV